MASAPSLLTVLREWGRIGCVGFGGPPAHIRLLQDLCVERRKWLSATEFEDAVAACNLLPGPASTQLSIFCAWRVRGRIGGLVGGAAFILPGLILILVLAALFLRDSPPRAVLAAGAGAGAAVAAVALHAAAALLPASWRKARDSGRGYEIRWGAYLTVGVVAAATIGSWLVLVLLACGAVEVAIRRPATDPLPMAPIPLVAWGSLSLATLPALIWTGFKVGALSYGGGFVIIPLMQNDAVHVHGWMSGSQFLNAVALGQITPGPVVHTVAVVGYAAAGLFGAVLAALIAFSPSFAFVLIGAPHFDRLRTSPGVRAFLDGAGPAAIGAIAGSAHMLARALTQPWQYVVLALAAVLLLIFRRGVVVVLLAAALAGVVAVSAGLPLP